MTNRLFLCCGTLTKDDAHPASFGVTSLIISLFMGHDATLTSSRETFSTMCKRETCVVA